MSDYFEMAASLQRPDPRDVMARIIAERRGLQIEWDRVPRLDSWLLDFCQDVPNRLYGATINSEGDAI